MKKVFIIILVSVFALGIILAGAGLVLTKGDFNSLFQSDTREVARIDEEGVVNSIKLSLSSDNVEFYPSADDKLHIDYFTSEQRPITYSLESGEARLIQDNKMWFYFGINISKTVKVYIPSGVTGSLTVMLSSGNVNTMEGLELDLESISINLSSGNADLKDITAENTNIDISSGDAELDGFETGAINADLSSGDLSISNSTISGGIDVNISSGHLTITNTSADVLTTDVSSGNVTAEGFTVNSVSTNSSSGDVELHLTGAPEDYSIDIDVSSGDILLDGGGVHMSTNSDLTWGTGSKHIDCDTSSGDVKIYFSDNN